MTRTVIGELVASSTSSRADILLLQSATAINVQRDDTYDDFMTATSSPSPHAQVFTRERYACYP